MDIMATIIHAIGHHAEAPEALYRHEHISAYNYLRHAMSALMYANYLARRASMQSAHAIYATNIRHVLRIERIFRGR